MGLFIYILLKKTVSINYMAAANKAMHRKIKATRFVCTRASASNIAHKNTPLSFPVIAAFRL